MGIKLDVYTEVLRRLKEDNSFSKLSQQILDPDFDHQLWAHFNRLPTRYASEVNAERAEDVLTHKRLLEQAVDPTKRPAFDVRLVQVPPVSNGNPADLAYSDSPLKDVVKRSDLDL